MRMLFCCMLYHKPLKLSSYLKNFLTALGEFCSVFQITDLSCIWCNLLWKSSSIFFRWVIAFFGSVTCYFLVFSTSWLNEILCSSIILPNSVSIFMTFTLNTFLGKLLICFVTGFFASLFGSFTLFFHLEPILLCPHFAGLFLWVKWNYLSWSWRSGPALTLKRITI